MTFTMSIRAAMLGLATLGLGHAAAADQLADVKAAGKIVTATDMHYAPFDMLNNGTYEGAPAAVAQAAPIIPWRGIHAKLPRCSRWRRQRRRACSSGRSARCRCRSR